MTVVADVLIKFGLKVETRGALSLMKICTIPVGRNPVESEEADLEGAVDSDGTVDPRNQKCYRIPSV